MMLLIAMSEYPVGNDPVSSLGDQEKEKKERSVNYEIDKGEGLRHTKRMFTFERGDGDVRPRRLV